jgi:hypothetical protein
MTQEQREHYQYMLANMQLTVKHRNWIIQQLEKEAVN